MPSCRSFLFALFVLVAPAAFAAPDVSGMEPWAAGRALADHAEQQRGGWESFRSQFRLVLRDARGAEAERSLEYLARAGTDVDDDQGRSVIVFDQHGTALVSHMHNEKFDEQWIRVPALDLALPTKSYNLTGAFMGSEFTFEDLRAELLDTFNYQLLREEVLDGRSCWVMKRTSSLPRSGYSYQQVWLDQEYFGFVKIDYYNRDHELLKSQTATNWQQYQGRWWRAGSISITNPRSGRSSERIIDTLEFDVNVTNQSFIP